MSTIPGWQPDPEGNGQRWHDGKRWTGVTRHSPESAARAATAERATHRRYERARRVRRLGLIAAGAACLVAVTAVLVVIDPQLVRPLAVATGIGRPHRLLPAVTPSVSSSSYAILNTDVTGAPVTYDPCKPVHYVINPDGAPPDYLAFIQPAVQRAQAATGLEFVYDGVSTDTWIAHNSITNSAPVLITFPTTLDSQAADGETVGLGGSTFLKSYDPTQPHYITGHRPSTGLVPTSQCTPADSG